MTLTCKYLSLVTFLLLSISATAQTFFTKEIKGKVTSSNADVADVHVLNISSHTATISDVQGFFTLAAKLNDTLVFSGVQYVKKEIVLVSALYNSSFIEVPLEEFTNELNEVTVTPYNLSGDLSTDMGNLKKEPLYTASTLGLPNAYVKPLTQSERLLREASMGPFTVGMLTTLPFNPIINAITGRTKMLKNRVKRDKAYSRTQWVQSFYPDSLYVSKLKIPLDKIDDFMYFCEVDESFGGIADTNDHLKIWEFLREKSLVYRENNALD